MSAFNRLLQARAFRVLVILAAVLCTVVSFALPPEVLWARGFVDHYEFSHLSPDGSMVTATGFPGDRKVIYIIRVADGSTEDAIVIDFVLGTQIAWSQDSSRLFVVLRGSVYQYSLLERQWSKLADAPAGLLTDIVAASPNGTKLVVGGQGTLAYFDLATSTFGPVLETGLAFSITNIKWLPNSAGVVTDGPNVFDLAGKRILTNTANIGEGGEFDISADGSQVVSRYLSPELVWRIRLTRLIDNVHLWDKSEDTQSRPFFLSNGRLIGYNLNNKLQLRQASNFASMFTISHGEVRTLQVFPDRLRKSAFMLSNHSAGESMQMSEVVLSSDNSSWRLLPRWSLIDSGKPISTCVIPVSGTPRPSLSMSGQIQTGAIVSTVLTAYDQWTGLVNLGLELDSYYEAASYSPDGTRLAATLWDLFGFSTSDLSLTGRLTSIGRPVDYLQVLDGGRILMYWRHIGIWETVPNVHIAEPGTGTTLVTAARFARVGYIRPHLSPSGNVIALAQVDGDNQVAVHNVSSGARISRFSLSQSSAVQDFRMISDTRMFVISASTSEISAQVWDVSAATPLLVQSAAVGRESSTAGAEIRGAIAPNGEFAVIAQRWEDNSVEINRRHNRIQVVRFDGNEVLRTQNDILVGDALREVEISQDSRVAYIRNGGRSIFALNVHIPNRIMGLTLNPAAVKGGRNSTATVNVEFPAPSAGLRINLSSGSSSASVPATVTVPAGQVSRTFTVTTQAVKSTTTATITASRDGSGSQSAVLSIVRPEIVSISVNPRTVKGGSSATATVTLDGGAPAGGLPVALRSNRSEAGVPATVTVPAGFSVATFTVTTVKVGQLVYPTLYATLNGTTRFVQMTIEPPRMTGFTLNPTVVNHGGTSTGTVTIDEAAPAGGVSVRLRSTNEAVAQVPASLVIPEGQTSATFAVSTSTVGAIKAATILATVGSATRAAVITVYPPALTAFTASPLTLQGGGTSTGTVTIEAAAPAGGLVVNLRASRNEARVPSTVTIPAGQTSATFTITTSAVTARTQVLVYATVAGRSRFITLILTP